MAELMDDTTFYARSPTILTTLHYASPIILFFFFLAFFLTNSVISAKKTSVAKQSAAPETTAEKSSENDQTPILVAATPARRLLFIWVTAAIITTFLANAAITIVHVVLEKQDNWWCGRDVAVYVVAGLFDFALILLTLVDSKPTPNISHLSTWILALLLEILTFVLELDVYSHTHREPTSSLTEPGRLRYGITDWEVVELTIDVVRIALLVMLIAMYLLFRRIEIQKRHKESQEDDKTLVEEASPLLSDSAAENYGSANGTLGVPTNGSDAPIAGVNNGGAADDQLPVQNGAADETTPLLKKSKKTGKKQETAVADKEPGWARKDKIPTKSWFEYLQGYTVFFPYLWPSKDMRLQALFVLCVIIVLIGRVVQVMVPIQVGAITNTLSGEDGEISVPWFGICFYIFLRFMQGSNGVLGAIRSQLWVPISQYSYRELTVAAFEHVHHLSLEFHLSKKTGEVISAIGKGSSINGFLEQITFQVVPMLIDLIIAIGYFLIYFDAYYALTVAVVVFIYLYVTMKMASWRVDVRRDWVNFSRQEDAIKNDSLMSYESVKYFNAENFEFSRFRDAVNKSQGAEYKVLVSLNYLNVSQNTIFLMGLLITSFIAAYQVSTGEFKVGRFVALLTYMAQLQQPLNFFGMFYRSIQSSMINSERLLEIFKEKNSVADRDGSQKLTSCEGDIKFQDVVFGYGPNKTALKGVTFHCKPGTTTALVGESGGGKSTIFRLLYRFYDINDGVMSFDGHDSKDLTIDSLRSHIGVVPQDTVLFNESIMYNLRYANQSATDEEIFNACRAASIHDKILTYDKGYDTIVGERGLKLSGGEKQRVAIARCLIKNPQIILLDEATASLDTETEENIQEALDSVLATGRTILVIAHRLSTITTADQILVMSNGRIVESGTHDELVEKKGKYANMWSKQIRAQLVLEKARKMRKEAEQLAKEGQGESRAGSSGASDDEDGSGAGPSRVRSLAPQSMTNSGFLNGHGPRGPHGHHGHGASDSRDGADHFHG